ncbi:MAG: hypothetical protein JRG81_17105 [Deltaproteobacteria bacterium]|nr:hypothetical protein [Deltaproteobacteria bacterium]
MDTRIILEVEPDLRPGFLGLLGFGFFVDVKTGCSLKEFLSDHMGLDPEYIEDRIQTIFLDGKAVDNIESCVIKNGSSIALSAAMPGVVGATLRRKSHYASMRGQISHEDEPALGSGTKGRVTIKLFNLIAKELGNELLEHGIRINGVDFKRFIDKLDKIFVGAIKSAQINDKIIDQTKLAAISLEGKEIFLHVRSY